MILLWFGKIIGFLGSRIFLLLWSKRWFTGIKYNVLLPVETAKTSRNEKKYPIHHHYPQ